MEGTTKLCGCLDIKKNKKYLSTTLYTGGFLSSKTLSRSGKQIDKWISNAKCMAMPNWRLEDDELMSVMEHF